MRYLFLAVTLFLSLTACQTLDTRSDARKLEATLDSYATTARWQPLQGLYAFLQPELQPTAPPASLANVRVTGYEITAAPREVADGQVVQTARIEYVLVDRQQVRSLLDNQLWVRDAGGTWQRANPIPSFE